MKKFISLTLVTVLFATLITSCSAFHECEFGEWETETPYSCTVDGIEVRYCKCGESEKRDVLKEHCFENSICKFCNQSNAYIKLTEFMVKNAGYDEDDGSYSYTYGANNINIFYYKNEEKLYFFYASPLSSSVLCALRLYIGSNNIETYSYDFSEIFSGVEMEGTVNAPDFMLGSDVECSYTNVTSGPHKDDIKNTIIPAMICVVLNDFQKKCSQTGLTVADLGFTSYVVSEE